MKQERDAVVGRIATGPGTRIERATTSHRAAFLDAVERSARLHHPWVTPPVTREAYDMWIDGHDGIANVAYLGFSRSGDLVGVVNVTQMVRGLFCSAYLGYYGFVPHQGKGYMAATLASVVSRAFRSHGMHRLEANIQPGNTASITLVQRLGFRKEGYSERYLKIGGRWRDHERWAITKEEWRRSS
jgi:ribosomal-protein-alanine N-acetyltransferase